MAPQKILIVDDSAAEMANLKAIVTEAGWLAVTAGSGREAVDKAKSDKPSLILMDIVMPEMDGYEACRALQADPVTKTIPIVMVSTKNQKADHMWAKMQGAKALVGKPYTKTELLDTIQSALS
ncbi:response regulator [Tahibacter amnicola]|uniref:Response regulator n=1 Tax=Tahibacter amnicola TaxID=2976241 RepID=A0ABY6BH99_9GAMM|nr:response regulator [Tahibacter amnicola]UXI69144.1 response regulator [Tahibacter amnicola]